MASSSDNVAKLKAAYREWHESKGGSVKAWLDLMVDDVRCFSLAAGAPEAAPGPVRTPDRRRFQVSHPAAYATPP